MKNRDQSDRPTRRHTRATPNASRFIDWFSKGDGVAVEANGNRTIIRIVDRKGRRNRLDITVPPGAVFRPLDRGSGKDMGEKAI